jgi:hypothetical protein
MSEASACSRSLTPSGGEAEGADAWGPSGAQLRVPTLGRFVDGVAGTSRAGAGLCRDRGAWGRPSARRSAASDCDARRSRPSGHAHALPVLARVRVARSRLERRRVLERPQRAIAGFPDPGAYRRSRPPSSTTSAPPGRTQEPVAASRSPARLSSPCCGAWQPVSRTRDRRRALCLAARRQDPHPRAVLQAGRDIARGRGRASGSARAARANAITWVIVRLAAQTAASVRHAEANRGLLPRTTRSPNMRRA